jgi:hypothetical protein
MWNQNNPFYYDIAAIEETDAVNPGTSREQLQREQLQVPGQQQLQVPMAAVQRPSMAALTTSSCRSFGRTRPAYGLHVLNADSS